MNNKRKELIKDIVNKCLKDKILKNELLFISLLGSSQTNEAVDTYSDLDILFIFKSDKSGAIQKQALTRLKKISEQISKGTNVEISLLTHTIFDLTEYVDLEYLIHYSWGKVIVGSQKSYAKVFSTLIDKKYSKEELRNLAYYDLIHARFNLIRKYVSWNRFNKNKYKETLLKLVIDKIIEMCDWALIYKGIFMKTKRGILKEFKKNFKKMKYGYVPQQAYDIRSNWKSSKFDEAEIALFIDDSIMFVQELIRAIHKEHGKN